MVEYRVGLKDLPAAERPRERLLHAGAENLKDSELLAIILRTGGRSGNVLDVANRLLVDFRGLAGIKAASVPELRRHDGVGQVKAIELHAAFELGRRLMGLNPGDRPQIRSPQDIANLLKGEMGALGQEHLKVLLLNTKNQVIASPDVYRGSLNTVGVRVGEIFREAIRQNSNALILVHNHPSGDPTPSPEDVALTRQVAEAGSLLDLELLDHVVIGSGDPGFVSLKERGLGFDGAGPGRDGLGRAAAGGNRRGP